MEGQQVIAADRRKRARSTDSANRRSTKAANDLSKYPESQLRIPHTEARRILNSSINPFIPGRRSYL
jgi:hypothetical protein